MRYTNSYRSLRNLGISHDLGLVNNGTFVPFGVLTLHRPSNVDSVETLDRLLRAIEVVADKLILVFPVHPRTRHKLAELGRKSSARVHMIDPVGYLGFLCLLSRSRLVLTDSGGIQEETTALGVPCLTLRENTERPVAVSKVFQGLGRRGSPAADVGEIGLDPRVALRAPVGHTQHGRSVKQAAGSRRSRLRARSRPAPGDSRSGCPAGPCR